MSKRLPYYQSEPAEYLAGEIMFCSYPAQGVFAILCALYWQKDCVLSLERAKRRIINAEPYFDELIKENIIKINGDEISINFLDNQFNELSKKSTTNSSNGKKGAEKRWGKNSENSESIAPLLSGYSESIALIEDKIIEDKIKEENNINNANFSQTSKTDMQWIETVAMQTRIKPDLVVNFIDTFESHLITMEEQKQTTKDFKTHFTHWLNKQDLSHFKTKTIGKTNQV